MATFFGRVDKSQWEHSALFAGFVPVYINNIDTDSPDIVEANWVPRWLLSLAVFLAVNNPIPNNGFMFTHVKRMN